MFFWGPYATHRLQGFTTTTDGLEYIVIIFHINTQKVIHITFVYRAHSYLVFIFFNNLQIVIQHSFEHCPIIILGDFNVDTEKKKKKKKKKLKKKKKKKKNTKKKKKKKNKNQKKKKKKLLNFMDKFKLKSQFNRSTIKVASQLDHI